MKTKTLALATTAALAAFAGPVAGSAQAACPAGQTNPAYCTPSSPAVATAAATAITNTTATLNGTIIPNGLATTYVFQYGQTTAYGQATAATSAGTADYTARNVAAAVAGLVPGTVYHARLVASNGSGIVAGADIAFTTTGTKPTYPGPVPKPQPVGKKRPALTLNHSPTRDTRKPYRYKASGKLKLPQGVSTAAGCKGTVVIRLTRGGKTVGRTTDKLDSKCRYSKRVSVSRKASRRLPRRGSFLLKARFLGNGALKADSAPSDQVFFGRRR